MNSFSTPSLPSVMRDFLEGTSARWEDISADKETFISKLLCPSVSDMNHKKLIELLKTLAPRQVCQYQVSLFMLIGYN